MYAKPAGIEGTNEMLAVRAHLFWFDPFQGVYELQAENVVVSIRQLGPALKCMPCLSFFFSLFKGGGSGVNPDPALSFYPSVSA